jgi:hypothetical protein
MLDGVKERTLRRRRTRADETFTAGGDDATAAPRAAEDRDRLPMRTDLSQILECGFIS